MQPDVQEGGLHDALRRLVEVQPGLFGRRRVVRAYVQRLGGVLLGLPEPESLYKGL